MNFSKSWLQARIIRTYVTGDSRPSLTFEQFLGLTLSNPNVSAVRWREWSQPAAKGIEIMVKPQGGETVGLLFKLDVNELVITHIVKNDIAQMVRTHERLAASMIADSFCALTGDEISAYLSLLR